MLLTGFTPFDGREVNASWQLARQVSTSWHDLEVSRAWNLDILEIPVRWNAPEQAIDEFLSHPGHNTPSVIVSLGEGRENWFDLETRANNQRQQRVDNDLMLPGSPSIHPSGPDIVRSSFDHLALQKILLAKGFPVRRSLSAGGFICEETLYIIEKLRLRTPSVKAVVFVHLPPWGTAIYTGESRRVCETDLLGSFGIQLVNAVLGMIS